LFSSFAVIAFATAILTFTGCPNPNSGEDDPITTAGVSKATLLLAKAFSPEATVSANGKTVTVGTSSTLVGYMDERGEFYNNLRVDSDVTLVVPQGVTLTLSSKNLAQNLDFEVRGTLQVDGVLELYNEWNNDDHPLWFRFDGDVAVPARLTGSGTFRLKDEADNRARIETRDYSKLIIAGTGTGAGLTIRGLNDGSTNFDLADDFTLPTGWKTTFADKRGAGTANPHKDDRLLQVSRAATVEASNVLFTGYTGRVVDCWSGDFIMKNGARIEGNNRSGNDVVNGVVTMESGSVIAWNLSTDKIIDARGLIMKGGEIASNASKNATVGIYEGRTFAMSGGNINNNYAGCVVEVGRANETVPSGGTFTMSGGEITSNRTRWFGGGVQINGPRTDENKKGGTFTKSGGVIQGNLARRKTSGEHAWEWFNNQTEEGQTSEFGHSVWLQMLYSDAPGNTPKNKFIDSDLSGNVEIKDDGTVTPANIWKETNAG
jgi:hypothetical protein